MDKFIVNFKFGNATLATLEEPICEICGLVPQKFVGLPFIHRLRHQNFQYLFAMKFVRFFTDKTVCWTHLFLVRNVQKRYKTFIIKDM